MYLPQIHRESSARIPTEHGSVRLVLYREVESGKEHLAMVLGDLATGDAVLTRIHSECFTGDVLGSLRCDCGDQLDGALRRIAEHGAGVVVYLRQEGRGIGLSEKLHAYNLQDLGYDTVDANRLLGHAIDARSYAPAARVLSDLGVRSVRLLSNNPAKQEGLEAAGMGVVERLSHLGRVTGENLAYLRTKATRMGHRLELGNEQDAMQAPAGRPLVTVSYAQSLDGSIAARPGRPLDLSGAEAMTMTHRLRANHQGILVGIGTVLADDPRLTVRHVTADDDPEPVVLDSRLRTPPTARLLRGKGRRVWIAAGEDADRDLEHSLTDAGARVLRLPTDDGGLIRLDALLAALRKRGMESIMVEGGGRVITNFLGARLVDHLVVTLVPTLIGGVRAVRSLLADSGEVFPRLTGLRHRRVGEDLVLSGRPRWDSGVELADGIARDEPAEPAPSVNSLPPIDRLDA